MLAASLKPAPFLAAFSPSARRSPAPSVAFPFPARLNQRPLLSAAATAEGTGASARQGEDSSSSFSAAAAAAPPIDEARLAQVRTVLIARFPSRPLSERAAGAR